MIDKSTVEHVAELARLELSDEEKEEYTQQLGNILDYVNKLDEVDTDNVQPTAHALPLKNVFRDDKVEKSLDREKVVENAPDSMRNYIRTPKIME